MHAKENPVAEATAAGANDSCRSDFTATPRATSTGRPLQKTLDQNPTAATGTADDRKTAQGEHAEDDKTASGIDLNDPVTGRPKAQATLLIELAGKLAKLFHDPERETYAEIERAGHREVYPVRSRDFSEILSGWFYDLTSKGCNRNALADALATIEAKAKRTTDPKAVHVRVARLGGTVYIDLCDDAWRVIEITEGAWRILDRSPVYFVRKRGMAPFPVPTPGGSIKPLERLLTVDTSQFTLIACWLTACLAGTKPYVAAILQGEQGTGKSWTSRILRTFIDPSTVPLRSPPREVRDLLVSARNGYLITLDNLSGLAPEISDALCRLCTGGGIDARQLYSDLEQVLVEIQRPILCNGIDDIATRPDLAERSILISLPVIDPAKRTPESVLSARLEREAGAIFGALLDGVAGALRALPDVRLDRLPRMADFALWGVAAESALGFKLGSFVKAYQANQDNAIEAGIEASPVGSALMLLMERSTTWTAAPTALLEQLTHIAGTQAKSKAWPQSPKGMANSFKRLAPSLRRVGIEIDQQQGNGRFYTITKGTRETHYPPNRMKPTPDGASSHADRHPDADHTGAYPPDDSLSACGKPSNDAASRRIGGSDGYAGACVSDDDNGPWSGIAAALREGT